MCLLQAGHPEPLILWDNVLLIQVGGGVGVGEVHAAEVQNSLLLLGGTFEPVGW